MSLPTSQMRPVWSRQLGPLANPLSFVGGVIYNDYSTPLTPSPLRGTPGVDFLGIDFKKVENMPAFRDTYSLQINQVECPIPNR
jgi:hypothetical protein